MVTTRREYFGKLLEPGLRKIFYEVYNRYPSLIPELFNMQTTSNPYEEDLSIGTLGDFPEFHGTIEYDRPYQGYTSLYEFPEYAKGFQVERKLYDDRAKACLSSLNRTICGKPLKPSLTTKVKRGRMAA